MNIKIFDDINLKVVFDSNETGITKVEFFNKNNKLIYSYLGNVYITRLDKNNFLIERKTKLISGKEKKCNDATFLYVDKDNYQIDEYPLRDNESVIINKALQEIKTVIIPGRYYYYLYSYDLGMIISASYDYIKYNEEENIFYVENYIHINNKTITLFGNLTKDGFLIDETLYVKELNKAYCVDSFNLKNHYEIIKKDIEKRMKREEKQKLYYKLEQEIYLKRKLR